MKEQDVTNHHGRTVRRVTTTYFEGDKVQDFDAGRVLGTACYFPASRRAAAGWYAVGGSDPRPACRRTAAEALADAY